MTTGKIVGIGVVALVGLFALIFVGSIFSFRTDCITAEAGIKAQYDQDKNNYDNMWKKFRELSQVNQSYADDMKKVFDSAIQGRYGAGGSKAVFQFIQEHNPTLSPDTYTRLQQVIDAGRNSFEADQKQLLDRKREYQVLLGSTTGLFVNPLLGFPRIDLDKFGIVTSDKTEEAFTKKKDDEIKLR